MIIFPNGLYSGERLGQCTDLARLHFPYIVGLINGYGRMELSIPVILQLAYDGFRNKPTKQELTAWLSEYREQHLLYVYRASDGSVWGQFCGIPPGALPRYQTAADRKSPAPDPEALEAFNAEYARKKRERAKASGDFVDLSEHFGNLPKASEPFIELPNISAGEDVGVGVGEDVGVGKEQQQPPSPSAAESWPVSSSGTNPQVVSIASASPEQTAKTRGRRHSHSSKPYHPRFEVAYGAYPKAEEKAASEREWEFAVQRLMAGEKGGPPLSQEDAWNFLEAAAAAYAPKMAGREPDKIRSMRRWLLESNYLDHRPQPKAVWEVASPEEWLGPSGALVPVRGAHAG